jgi:hypothetical protein
MFPTNVFAKLMGYKKEILFSISDEEKQSLNAKDFFKNE